MHVVLEWFQPINLPATILLLLCLGYWLMVITGFLGMEFLDIAMDLDIEVDGSLDAADLGSAGLIGGAFRFLHIGEIPFMIVFTILSFCIWLFTTVTNHYWNPEHQWLLGFGIMLASVVGAIGATKLLLQPFLGFFRNLDYRVKRLNDHLGETCIIDTAEVTETFGEAKIDTGGSPVVIQVRNPNRFRLTRGDAAELVRFDSPGRFFEVRPLATKPGDSGNPDETGAGGNNTPA